LPRVGEFMQRHSELSLNYKQRNDTTYIYSQGFKLQATALAELHSICIAIEIQQVELEQLLLSVYLPYLDKRQPVKLQELAVEALRCFAQYSPDVVWLCAHYIPKPSSSLAIQTGIFSSDIRFKIKDLVVEDKLWTDILTIYNSL